MCGIPGSGKTTLSQQLATDLGAAIYCYDTFPKKHWRYDAHQLMYNNIIQELKNAKIVICDDLHITKTQRERLINALHDVECEKVLHVMLTPLDICLERNRQRDYDKGRLPDIAIKHYLKEYEPPVLEEGWDRIIYHEYIKE